MIVRKISPVLFPIGIFAFVFVLGTLLTTSSAVMAQASKSLTIETVEPGRYKALTEPPCSYCSTQHRKGLVEGNDRVVAWIRAAHNGGAIPIRHFLAGPRVINDTYGLFFYDPDGGYVAAYEKDYGYELIGWRRGVMVVRGKDGTLWSALSGVAIDGPQQGKQLKRIPALVTTWEHWMMLHPESTAYNLYDGKKYPVTPLPTRMSNEAKHSMGKVDDRLAASAMVLGVEFKQSRKAYPLEELAERAVFRDKVGDQNIAVLWYGPTRTAVAFESSVDGRSLTLYADDVSPETAPFKDKETGTRWTLAGRAVDGPLRGRELTWINSIQCRWYAWSAEYPMTQLHGSPAAVSKSDSGQLEQKQSSFHGALLSAEQVTDARIDILKESGVTAIALPIHNNADSRAAEQRACGRIRASGLGLYYWVEVARCPELANEHPEWMASLQGHTEWRRLFKNAPTATTGQVVKTYPWVPVLNRQPFAGQLSRVETLLQDRPTPDGVFLNDIQGAPSACGCGSHLCRWTSDYGKLRSTTPLGNDAPANFVAAVRKLQPKSEIIPVWTTECEEHDGSHDGLCAGVGCFKGICWKAYTAQLMPVVKDSRSLGVLLPYKSFQRDLPVYGSKGGWIAQAVKSFETMPPLHNGQSIPATKLTTVLQGWDVSESDISNQIEVANKAGVNRILVAYVRIEQDWQPKLVNVK